VSEPPQVFFQKSLLPSLSPRLYMQHNAGKRHFQYVLPTPLSLSLSLSLLSPSLDETLLFSQR